MNRKFQRSFGQPKRRSSKYLDNVDQTAKVLQCLTVTVNLRRELWIELSRLKRKFRNFKRKEILRKKPYKLRKRKIICKLRALEKKRKQFKLVIKFLMKKVQNQNQQTAKLSLLHSRKIWSCKTRMGSQKHKKMLSLQNRAQRIIVQFLAHRQLNLLKLNQPQQHK